MNNSQGTGKYTEVYGKIEFMEICLVHDSIYITTEFIKGRFLLFQVYRNFAKLFSKLSVNTFYMEISKFQQTVQGLKKIRLTILRRIP